MIIKVDKNTLLLSEKFREENKEDFEKLGNSGDYDVTTPKFYMFKRK